MHFMQSGNEAELKNWKKAVTLAHKTPHQQARFRSITAGMAEDGKRERNVNNCSPCALLFFSFARRFFNAESKSSFDRMGRTLGLIIFFGASVVVVVVVD
jgi:hypothetical protein